MWLKLLLMLLKPLHIKHLLIWLLLLSNNSSYLWLKHFCQAWVVLRLGHWPLVQMVWGTSPQTSMHIYKFISRSFTYSVVTWLVHWQWVRSWILRLELNSCSSLSIWSFVTLMSKLCTYKSVLANQAMYHLGVGKLTSTY